MEIKDSLLKQTISLRHTLHQHPELSRLEEKTAAYLIEYLKNSRNKIVPNIANNGFAVVYESQNPGPRLLFRTDMDALPIQEETDLLYSSETDSVSHMCGHDGHMAILSGLSSILEIDPPKKGSVVLLFQPSEEVGEGALAIISDVRFASVEPDYVFALHNLPGFPLGHLILRNGAFAAASRGFIARLFGKTSHAGQPEKGISPANAIAESILELNNMQSTLEKSIKDYVLVTIIHARLGEIAFGTSPGYGEIMATLRAFDNIDMELLANAVKEKMVKIAISNNLKIETDWTDIFPATINNDEAVHVLENAANNLGIPILWPDTAFRWSEDFGYFTAKYPGALFGLGSGIDHPRLHNPNYDFPDEIIAKGMKIFNYIVRHFNG